MVSFRRLSDVLDSPRAYEIWQAPFAATKMAPLERHNHLPSIGRVLEVGCGPGTNAAYFAHTHYVGLDFNPQYTAYARQRYGREFITADARTYAPPADARYDCILLNSFLHHIDDENALIILRRLHEALNEGGHIHILDLVLPERASLARWLARRDRGDYPRPMARWRELLDEVFEPVIVEPFAVGKLRIPMWQMFYFKGRSRR
ncbi:MAG: class I SAM-dependent methyltransferase [Planctomycetia bacterium]|nr:class I SAM-dependent methyltransferase [Planctomycetia bacterium]